MWSIEGVTRKTETMLKDFCGQFSMKIAEAFLDSQSKMASNIPIRSGLLFLIRLSGRANLFFPGNASFHD